MVLPWSWRNRAKDREGAVRPEPRDGGPAKGSAEGADEGGDRLFEGGGAVLLRPSYWERAGWGIVVLAALAASAPTAGAAPCPGARPAGR